MGGYGWTTGDSEVRLSPARTSGKQGCVITTSLYSREALEYVGLINTKIILIDGGQLATLMVDHNVGVSTIGTYELKKIDTDYFEGE
ncbi:MAG: restriction endonuclease [Methylotetracoccus sp.]